MKRMNTFALIATLFTLAISTSYASQSSNNVTRLTRPTLLGLSTYQPTHPTIAFAPLYSDTQSSIYLEAHDVNKKICYDTFFGDCHYQKNILIDVLHVSKHGRITRILNDWFASGQEPSIAPIGNGYFVLATSTQDAHAIQGYVVKLVQKENHYKLEKIHSVNLGRGTDPSLAAMGNGYFMVTSSNDNNETNQHFLAAYVFQASAEGIKAPEYMTTYADGSVSAITSIGDNKLLETNNNSGGIEYNIMTTNDNKITTTPLKITSGDLSNISYASVQLTPTNIIGPSGNKEFLEVYSIIGHKGLYSRLIDVNGETATLTQPYQYDQSSLYPAVAQFQDKYFIEVDINKTIFNATGLYAGILS